MTRRRSIAVMMVLALQFSFVSAARANPAIDICASLVNARTALYSMMKAKDQSARDALKLKMQAASTKLDSALADLTDADAKTAAEFKAIWDQFKTTRDKEIIPAIYRDNTDDAKKLADGIQYERFSKMWSIMSCK